MTRRRRWLCGVYYGVALIALIGTWRQNLAFSAGPGLGPLENFVQFWPALLANRATISITVDLFAFGLAAVVWMVLEARRLGVRWVWLYVLFGFLIAISVTYPLFLAARERRLAAIEAAATEPAVTASDLIGLLALASGTLALIVYCTLL